VLKYLKGTLTMGLRFEAREERIIGYSDASLRRTDIEGKSTIGCVIKLYRDTGKWSK